MNLFQRFVARLIGLNDARIGAHNLYTRASLEDPRVPISDPRVWEKIFGGEPSDAGINVNPRTALEFSPVWKAVSMVSQDVSCIPTFVYRRTREGGKTRAYRHPAFKLLRRKANHLMTSQLWKQITIAQAMLYGGSYSLINRDQFANPTELLPLSPADTYPVDHRGRIVYRTMIDGREQYFDWMDVFHVPGVMLDGLQGLSLIDFARRSLGRGLAADKYSAKFFANNTMPAGVLSHPHRLSDTAMGKLRESMQKVHGGLDAQHRVAILEEGMSWTPMGVDPEKAQMIASMEFAVKDVARWFNIPAHRLGDDAKTSYNSVEQENLAYHESTLTPWFTKLREEAFEKLLSERQKRLETHTVEELRVAILQADSMTRANFYSRGILDGWLSRDEVRAYENLNPIPDGGGGKFLVPLNMQVLGEDPPEESPGEDDDDDQDQDVSDDQERAREALLVGLQDATGRAIKRLAHYAERAAKKPQEFCGWLDNLHAQQEATVQSMFDPTVRAAAALGVDVPDALRLAHELVGQWYAELDSVAREAPAAELTAKVTRRLGKLTDPSQLNKFARRQLWNGDPVLVRSS